jgi:hypothetical protein
MNRAAMNRTEPPFYNQMNPVFLKPKIIHFNQVDVSKTSFPAALSDDEKVFTTKQSQFCM